MPTWEVLRTGAGAALRVELEFDSRHYQAGGARPNDSHETPRARDDFEVYLRLREQLASNDAAVGLAIGTTLLPKAPVEVPVATVSAWLGAVADFLADRARGGTAADPPRPLRLQQIVDPSIVNDATLFPLMVDFTIRSHRELGPAEVDAPADIDAPADGDGPASVDAPADTERFATRIPPRLARGEPDSSESLRRFARRLEEALSTETVQLKLLSNITRPGPTRAYDDPVFWVLRSGTGPGAVQIALLDFEPPLLYAPQLLSTDRVSCSGASIREYRTGTRPSQSGPTPAHSGRRQTFSGVEPDLWLRQVLQWMDILLSPASAGAIQRLGLRSGVDYLATLFEQKQQLADAISWLLAPVLSADRGDPTRAAREAARLAFRQSLMLRLQNVYDLLGVAQFRLAAEACHLPKAELAGVVATHPADGDGRRFPNSRGRFIVSAATQPESYLTAVLCWDEPGAAFRVGTPSHTLSLEFLSRQVEWPPGPVLAAAGPARTRAFLLSPPEPGQASPLSTRSNGFAMPTLLSALPPQPTVLGQRATRYENDLADQLIRRSKWEYSMEYRQEYHHPQDRVEISVATGMSDSHERAAAEGDFPSDLAALAEFAALGTEVWSDLDLEPVPPTGRTRPTSPFQVAEAAMEWFIDLTQKLIAGWRFPLRPGLHSAGRPSSDPGPGESITYSVEELGQPVEESGEGARVLTIVVRPVDASPPDFVPEVRVPGWFTRPVTTTDGTFRYRYVDQTGTGYLRETEGRRIPERTFVLPNLSIFSRQGVRTGVTIVRNAGLLPGKAIANPFVYRTATVSCTGSVAPDLEWHEPVEITRLESGTRVRRPLVDHLEPLFSWIVGPPSWPVQWLRLVCTFESLVTAEIRSSLPIPVFQLSFEPRVGEEESLRQSMPRETAGAIEEWCRQQQGLIDRDGSSGKLKFDLTVRWGNESQRARLRYSALELDMANIVLGPAPDLRR